MNRLIADLDSDSFAKRESAERELAGVGELARPALERALKGRPSLEALRRVQGLLDRLRQAPSGEQVRLLRSVELLEYLGTPEARSLLQALAGGAAEARLTQEARASLERLGRARSMP
jgi:hypothetical protein